MQAHTNIELADILDRIGELLGAQDDIHRAGAFRRAADAVRGLPGSVVELYRERGIAGLDAIPSIGKSIASLIAELVETGHSGFLARLEGQVSPEDLFATVPGIGSTLAHHVVLALDIDSLEELELAAHDGRLERVHGFGPRRARAVREVLASRLAHTRTPLHRAARERIAPPEAATILDVDEEYRRRAIRGELSTITPRRFNPTGAAWLPVLHTARDGWAFTALFSNSARAHSLGRTRDWVVVFFEKDGRAGQCTVVTELRGPKTGRRVIRGRENECAKLEETLHDRPAFPPCPRCGRELEAPSSLFLEPTGEDEMVCSLCRRAKSPRPAAAHGPVP